MLHPANRVRKKPCEPPAVPAESDQPVAIRNPRLTVVGVAVRG